MYYLWINKKEGIPIILLIYILYLNILDSRFDILINIKKLTLDFFNDIDSASEETYTVVAVPSGWLIRIWTEYKCVNGS